MVTVHPLGMPLDSQRPPVTFTSGRFDETVVSSSFNHQTRCQHVDALMVQGVHLGLFAPVQAGQQRPGLETDHVTPGADVVRIGVLIDQLVNSPVGCDLLLEGSTEGHVEKLKASTNREHRLAL